MNIIRIINDYDENSMSTSSDNLNKMKHFLESFKWPKLTEGNTDNMNSSISINNISRGGQQVEEAAT
jgi:hypothetical protein